MTFLAWVLDESDITRISSLETVWKYIKIYFSIVAEHPLKDSFSRYINKVRHAYDYSLDYHKLT